MQSDLFKTSDSVIHQLGDASLTEYPCLFSPQESDRHLKWLIDEIPWHQADITIAGKVIPIPRLQCWIGDFAYTYSGISMQPLDWPQRMLPIKAKVEQATGYKFNTVLANYYRDGHDSVAWHSDDEPELGANPIVASVSFGAARLFEMKPKNRTDIAKQRLTLQHGSVLLMDENVQTNWQHQVPKSRSITSPRINLTFRRIIN